MRDLRCYNVIWRSLRRDFQPYDCIYLEDLHWHGAGDIRGPGFPLEKQQQRMSPFISGEGGPDGWGTLLYKSFISRNGIAVTIADEVPLHASIKQQPRPELCLKSSYDSLYYYEINNTNPILKYSVCIGKNLKHSAETLLNKVKEFDIPESDALLGLKSANHVKETHTFKKVFSRPISELKFGKHVHVIDESKVNPRFQPIFYYRDEISEQGMLDWASTVVKNDIFNAGTFVISEKWQKYPGDLLFNPTSIKNATKLLDILKRKGFKVYLEISPFVYTGSKTYRNSLKRQLLIQERARKVPALTIYHNHSSVAVFDLAKENTLQWFHHHLIKTAKIYGVAGFFINPGTGFSLPREGQFKLLTENTNAISTYFLKTKYSKEHKGFLLHSRKVFPRTPTWENLQSLTSSIINLGLNGIHDVLGTCIREEDSPIPEELYIRWMQLVMFLPKLEICSLPQFYSNKVINVVR